MERKPYTTDLTDEEWKIIEPLLPKELSWGRPRKYSYREILNGMFYVIKTGCQWRNLPHDLPPWSLVYYYFWTWQHSGLLQKINDELVKKVRVKEGRSPDPTLAIIDSQTVKTTEAANAKPKKNEEMTVGYDGGKCIKGRKRQIVVDTLGLLLGQFVHSGGVADSVAAKRVIPTLLGRFPLLQKILADGRYGGGLIGWVKLIFKWTLEVVSKPKDQKGFQVIPKRWIVERTFAWFGKYRRLSKDYEANPRMSEAMLLGAMIRLMLRRLART